MAGHRPVNPDPNFRRCPRCREVKPITDYHLNRSGTGGRCGYCKPCQYARSLEYAPSTDVAERFWPKVDKNGPGGCWLWTGAKNTRGYGQIHVGGKERLILAHRFSLILAGREVPPPGRDIKNGVIDHICKVHACVNPAHLRVVRQEDNCGIYAAPTPHFINKMKTHCTPGNHPFAGDNLHYAVVSGKLRRVCIACQRAKRPGTSITANTPETARVVPRRFKND